MVREESEGTILGAGVVVVVVVGLVGMIRPRRTTINHREHRKVRREEQLPVNKDIGPGSGQVRLAVLLPVTSLATEAGISERNTGPGVSGRVVASGEVGIRAGASLGIMPGKEVRGGAVVARDRLVRPTRLPDTRARVLDLPAGDDHAMVETVGFKRSGQVFWLSGY